MANASNFLEEAVLNFWFRGQAMSSPGQLYLALYINNPGDTDTGTEVSGGAYARQAITFSTPSQISDKATISNTNNIEFPTATSAWGNISHYAVRTALTGGTMLCHGAFTQVEALNTGNKFAIEPGNLQVTIE